MAACWVQVGQISDYDDGMAELVRSCIESCRGQRLPSFASFSWDSSMRSFKLLPLASAIRGGLAVVALCTAVPALAAPPQFDIHAGNIEDVL
ncbi:MAG: hypothetical protein RR326_08425, partial [Stenotrophomonas sp.]